LGQSFPQQHITFNAMNRLNQRLDKIEGKANANGRHHVVSFVPDSDGADFGHPIFDDREEMDAWIANLPEADSVIIVEYEGVPPEVLEPEDRGIASNTP
jgi:hypothetical protein